MRILIILMCWLLPTTVLALAGGQLRENQDVVVLSRQGGYCSATVVAKGIALTAAHCIHPKVKQAIYKDKQFFLVKRFAIHPQYKARDWANRRTAIDLALVEFESQQTGTFSPLQAIPNAGDSLILFGYGTHISGVKEKGGVSTLTLVVTGAPSRFQVRLTGSGGACVGDSGGPAFTLSGQLAGVISWRTGLNSQGCGELTGLTPVAPYASWIYKVIDSWK